MFVRPAALLLALPLVLTGCDNSSPTPAPNVDSKPAPPSASAPTTKAADAEPDEKPAEAAPAAPLTIAAGAPGPALFMVDKTGVVRLEAGKFTVTTNGPTGMSKGLQVGGDGHIWSADYNRVMRLEGDDWKPVHTDLFTTVGGTLEDFVVTKDGQIWGVAYKGIAHHDGKAWTMEDKSVLGVGEELLQGVAVDPTGRPWISTSDKLFVRDGAAWKEVDLKPAKGRKPYFLEDVRLAPDGAVLVRGMSSVFRVGPDLVASKLKLGSADSYSELGLSTNGGVILRDIDRVIAAPIDGKLRVARAGRQFAAGSLSTVALDDGGRMWIGSEFGVSIVGADGSKIEWASGTVPELAGSISRILVLGSGPAEMPGAGPVRKGGLTGKLLKNGEPLADTVIEICPSPSFIYSRTPCSDGPVRFSGKSDAQGVWSFAEVPLGDYGVAVKLGSKWKTTLGGAMASKMKEGEVYDVGSLELGDK